MTDAETVRLLVKERIEALDLNMADISRQIGRNPTYVQQYIKRRSPVVLPEVERHKIAEILRIPESSLRSTKASHLPKTEISPVIFRPAPYPFSGTRDLPILGAAVGGIGGPRLMLNGDAVEYVDRPGDLIGVTNAYGLYVVEDSMSPRYCHGEMVYVNPNKPVNAGHFVIVQFWDEDPNEPLYTIKQFVRQDAKRLKLRQLNPDKEIEIPSDRVIGIHRVVGAREVS